MATACALAISAADPQTPGGIIPTCPTAFLFGIDCPGCGSMRMIEALVHGDVLAALRFNALGVVGLFFLTWSYAAWIARRIGKQFPDWTRWRYASITTGAAIAVWFIARVLPFEPFLSLRV